MPSALRPSAIALLLACACASPGHEARDARSEVYDLIRRGSFGEAYARARELRDARPGDPELESLHRDATLALLLAQGRDATFDGKLDQALARFEEAARLAPGSAVAAQWLEKTRTSLAERWLNDALNLHAEDRLPEAIAAYEKALEYRPGYESALRGIESARSLAAYRQNKAEGYYDDGVRALAAYWLEEARWRFGSTGKYLPEHGRARLRSALTSEMLSEQRSIVAEGLEERGLFAAAEREYKLALRLDPRNGSAAAGLERVIPEVKAARTLDQAEMYVLRERYEEALAELERAEKLTKRQADRVESLRARIGDQRLQTLYARALNLEKDQRYPEAIAAYGELLALVDYYEDAQTRRGTLEEYVRLAAQYYEAAEAESDPRRRLELFSAIRGFWSEYRDVTERVRELEAQLPREAPGEE